MRLSESIERYNDDFALKFNDNDSLQGSPDLSFINVNTDFSISLWYYRGATGSFAIMGNRIAPTYANGFWFGTNAAQKLFVAVGGVLYDPLFNDKLNVWNHVAITNKGTTKNLKIFINSVKYLEVTQTGSADIGSTLYVGKRLANYNGSIRNISFFDSEITQQDVKNIYIDGIIPDNIKDNLQHYYPINATPTINGASKLSLDVAKSYNSLATQTDLSYIGWTDLELGIPDINTSTTYRDWKTKNNLIPSDEYKTGLNITNLQSITIDGLTIGDKLVVNYDESGVRKQDVITVNAVNYTYTPSVTIKIRLITVLKDGFYANNKVYKTIFNDGSFRSGILSSYTEVINAETNLTSPFDDAGTLKFPDLSTNNRVIIANGYTDLADLQANIN